MGVTTAPTAQMMRLVRGWEELYPSAVFSGINGDAAHHERPTKHLSRSFNRDKFGAGAWPISTAKDKQGPSDKACAGDMSMAKADMVRSHDRIKKVFDNRRTDPRAQFFGAFNTWDGSGDAVRFNFVSGKAEYSTPDHKWHDHGETFYAYVNSGAMVDAWLSALRGDTVAQYQGGDDLVTTQAEFNKLMMGALKDPTIAAQFRAFPWQYNGRGIADNDLTPEGNIGTLGVLDSLYDGVIHISKAVAARDDIDESALAEALAPAVATLVIAALPTDNDDVTVDELIEAFRRAIMGPQAPVA